jgi:hypothetical protein
MVFFARLFIEKSIRSDLFEKAFQIVIPCIMRRIAMMNAQKAVS